MPLLPALRIRQLLRCASGLLVVCKRPLQTAAAQPTCDRSRLRDRRSPQRGLYRNLNLRGTAGPSRAAEHLVRSTPHTACRPTIADVAWAAASMRGTGSPRLLLRLHPRPQRDVGRPRTRCAHCTAGRCGAPCSTWVGVYRQDGRQVRRPVTHRCSCLLATRGPTTAAHACLRRGLDPTVGTIAACITHM